MKLNINDLAIIWLDSPTEKNFTALYNAATPKMKLIVWKEFSKNSHKNLYCKGEIDDDVNDIVHEAWTKIQKFSYKFDRNYVFMTWVYAIVRNEFLNFFKIKNRYQKVSSNNFEEEDSLTKMLDQQLYKKNKFENITEDDFESKFNSLVNQIQNEFQNSPNVSQMIIEREFEKTPYAELSKKYNMPLDTIKVTVHRNRKEIANKFQKEFEDLFGKPFIKKVDKSTAWLAFTNRKVDPMSFRKVLKRIKDEYILLEMLVEAHEIEDSLSAELINERLNYLKQYEISEELAETV